MKRLSMYVFCLLAVLIPAMVRAAALDERVPQDAVVFISWQGADALAPQFGKSNLKSIIEASTVRAFIESRLPMLLDRAGANDPDAAKKVEKAKTALDILWRHPTAFYMSQIDFSNPERPAFRFGFICDAGADAKTLADIVKEALAEAPPSPDLPMNVLEDGTRVILTFGKATTVEELSKGGGLAGTPGYFKAVAAAKGPATPAYFIYVDAAKLLANVEDGIAKSPMPEDNKTMASKVIGALGVRSLTQICMSAGFDNQGWTQSAFVGINGERKGVLSLMDSTPLSDGLLTWVPKEAMAVNASKFDLAKLYAEVRAFIPLVNPEALDQMDRGIAMANGVLGVDIEKDIIAAVGDEWLIYRSISPDDGGLTTAFVQKLRDPDRFAKALATLETFYNEKSGAPIKIEKLTTGKIEVSTVNFPPNYSIAWVVRNGYLYVSSVSGLPTAVAQVENKGPSILENDNYKAVMAKMPAGIKPVAVQYSHPARLYPELRQLLIGILPLVSQGAGIEIPMDLLPDPAAVRDFMTPGGNVTWSDTDGIHSVGHTAFPGAELLGGGGSQMGTGTVAVAALGTAILLPSLSKARELANRSTDLANARGIVMGCIIWSADNADAMPDHVARLVAAGQAGPKWLVSRRNGTEAMQMTPENIALSTSDFAKFASLVDEHCDFVYLGKGMKSEMNADVVVVYQKPSARTQDGIVLGYQDGHSEFERWAGLKDAFSGTNAYLKSHNLPPVDVDAILKAAGK